jgi:hypothetical protein
MNPNSSHSFRRKKVLLWLIGLPVGMLMLVVLAGFLYGDRAKQLVVDELNSHLLIKVDVGEIDFSVLRSFPDASVVLRNIATRDGQSEMPVLLNARSVSLRFGIFGLITGNYSIQSIQIDEASINLWIDDEGKNNFQIWESGAKTSGKPVNFDVNRVHFNEVKVYYRNLQTNLDLAIGLPDFNLRANKLGEIYHLALKGDIAAERITLHQKEYGISEQLSLKLSLKIDDQQKIVIFDKSDLIIAGVNIAIEGNFKYATAPYPLEFNLTTTRADIAEMFHVLPVHLRQHIVGFEDYETAGLLDAEVVISGMIGKDQAPFISSDFKLKKASLLHKKSSTRLYGISAEGNFSAGSNKSEHLLLKHFEGSTRSGNFKGKVLVSGFKQPLIDLTLNAKLNLSEIEGFIGDNLFDHLKGQVITDITYKGNASGSNIAGSTQGSILLENATFMHKQSGRFVSDLNASLELGNGVVYVNELSLKSGNTDLKLKGRFQNLMEQFFFRDKPLHFDAEIASSQLDLEDLMAFSTSEKQNEGNIQLFQSGLSFDVILNIDHLKYRKFSATGASGNLILNNQVLKASNLRFKAMDGDITGNGLLNMRYGNKASVLCDADFRNVDIQRVFYEFNDFGQSSLKSSHLKGRADVKVNFSSMLDDSFDVDANSVNALADVEIRNGELVNFEPLQELSRFLNASELKNVKFSTLNNRIEVLRQRVIIPEMEVKSSVMNLKGYGSHTFGNEIDYHLNVLLSELTRKKSRRPAPEQSMETDAAGNTRLFLYLSGTVDHPEFRYDSQAVARKIAGDFKNQKQELKQVLRDEFGKNKQSTRSEPAQGVKFDIEWDENK